MQSGLAQYPRHDPTAGKRICPATAMPWAQGRRRARGRQAYHSGIAAEESVARAYASKGAEVVAQRTRTPYGEIDLIARDGGTLVFVEVKKRKRLDGWDSPVSSKQWERLKNSALHYSLSARGKTGVHPILRFDLAIVGPDGAVRIIENARSFDEH
ncbi:MAG: YraN family protein [Pseudomonadota bacterium]